jgi:HD-like signal output (HDOD) protein
LASKHSESYTKYINDQAFVAPLAKQQSHFGFTFPECSGHIIKEWKLPDSLVLPLQKLQHPASQKINLEESILYVAMSMVACEGIDGDLEDMASFNKQALETVGLSDEDYDMILSYSRLETSKIANVINS